MLRKKWKKLAEYADVPVINALTDFAHPCQVLADLMTIREYKRNLTGLKICYIGDGNNMANSLIVGCLKVGMKVVICSPDGYEPDGKILEFAKEYGDNFKIDRNPLSGAKGADIVYTDVWSSMGQEDKADNRKSSFIGYQINDDVIDVAKPDCMVLHCLPAHREEEITAKVLEAHSAEIFEEAENRLHVQKALLVTLMK